MNCHPILALTGREKEAIALVRKGLKNADIAVRMDVQSRTIGDYLYNAMSKLNARNRIQLILMLDGRMKVEPELMPTATNQRKLLEANIKSLMKQQWTAPQIARKLGIEIYIVYEFFKKMRKNAVA